LAFIQYFARIQFEHGARKLLSAELASLGLARPLVVTDRGVADCGVLDEVLAHLENRKDVAVFDRIPGNPTIEAVELAVAEYQSRSCDGIVAIGGGSVLDAAKAVALLATHPAPIERYLVENGGGDRITAGIAPVVSVPTTAGTGSEIGRGMGITLGAGGAKGVFLSPHLIPRVAICDPELTLSLPPWLTAGTGIDAFSHCLEAYLSAAINPPVDAIALDGIERMVFSLPRAVRDGQDREARWNMMMGAIEGAMSAWKGFGAAHAVSMPLDSFDVHHGTAVGVLLPHATEFVLGAVPQSKRDKLAAALGCASTGIPAFLSALNAEIGLPRNLAAMSVDPAAAEEIATEASRSIFARFAPRQGSTADYLALVKAAMN